MSSCRTRKAGSWAAIAVAVACVSVMLGSAPARSAVGPNPVLRWNGVLLDTVRSTRTPVTVAARALAITNTCMYDAWAAYDPVAVGTRLGGSLRRPAEDRTIEAQDEAMSPAAPLALTDPFPAAGRLFATA